jgi:hypothetical protein
MPYPLSPAAGLSLTALILGLALLGAAPGAAQDHHAAVLAAGDTAWAKRAQGDGIAPALSAYRKAVESRPSSLEARWKLLRALYFEGEFTLPASERMAAYDESLELARETLEMLVRPMGGLERFEGLSPEARAKALRGEPEAAGVLFWAAVHWGLWGENTGVFKAARQGVGGRIRDLSETVVRLDERFESAGGHRMLGRLHAVAPKIPLFTGWVDRDEALVHLRRAWRLAPEEPYNGLYLAEAIFEHDEDRRVEALGILRELAGRRPRNDHRVEDTAILVQARELLAAEGGAAR